MRRRGIYKDLYKSSKPRSDYQLRPNYCIAIALAPELFMKQHGAYSLAVVEKYLIEESSLGVKGLDKVASEYYGCYEEGDSDNMKSALGFSKHNGVEWVWIYGFYLKSILKMHGHFPSNIFHSYLYRHQKHIIQQLK